MDPRITAAANADQAKRPIDAEALERYRSGEGDLGAAFNLDAADLNAIRQRGLALLEAGQAEGARAVFEALVALGDTDAGVRLMLANACEGTGDLSAAIQHFEHAMAHMQEPSMSAMRTAAMTWGQRLLTVARRAVEQT